MAKIRFLQDQGIDISNIIDTSSNKKGPTWTEMKYSCLITDPEIEQLCREMLIWARTTKSVRATTFMVDFEILPGTFGRWCQMYPQLQEAYEQVKLYFAEKRENGVLNGDYNPALVLATLPTYCKEYYQYRKDVAASKAQQASGGNVIKVFMDKSPETDIVPDKCLGGTECD